MRAGNSGFAPSCISPTLVCGLRTKACYGVHHALCRTPYHHEARSDCAALTAACAVDAVIASAHTLARVCCAPRLWSLLWSSLLHGLRCLCRLRPRLPYNCPCRHLWCRPASEAGAWLGSWSRSALGCPTEPWAETQGGGAPLGALTGERTPAMTRPTVWVLWGSMDIVLVRVWVYTAACRALHADKGKFHANTHSHTMCRVPIPSMLCINTSRDVPRCGVGHRGQHVDAGRPGWPSGPPLGRALPARAPVRPRASDRPRGSQTTPEQCAANPQRGCTKRTTAPSWAIGLHRRGRDTGGRGGRRSSMTCHVSILGGHGSLHGRHPKACKVA